MFKEHTKYYTISDVINLAISKSLESGKKKITNELSIHIINDMTYTNIWNTFTKWCQIQAEVGYMLSIYQFGTMYQVSDQTFEGVSMKLSDYFLKENNLKWDEWKFCYDKVGDSKNSNPIKIQKLNLLAISSELNLPKVYVQTGLNNMFMSIGSILNTTQACIIDLNGLGNVYGNNKVVYHTPPKIKADGFFNNKTKVKTLLRIKKTNENEINTGKSIKIEEIKETLKISELKNFVSQKSYINQFQLANAVQNDLKEKINFEKIKPNFNYNEELNKKRISFNFIPNNSSNALLNIGENKLKQRPVLIPLREQDYNMKVMLDSTFIRMERQRRSNSPVLFNNYSHTKAAPFTSEKTQIPLSHRIGSFYSLPLQNFIINKTSKSIARLFDEYFTKYKHIIFEIPATEEEEYRALFDDSVDKNKILLRKETYDRYKHYINYISDDCICEIKEKWLINVVKMCLRAYDLSNSEKYSLLLDGCIREIVQEYKLSIKKSILDYILIHPEQKEKLGIPVAFRKTKPNSVTKVKRPSDDNKVWKDRWTKSKFYISNNLLVVCENITKILKFYMKNLQNTSYLDLPENQFVGTIKLNTFLDNQRLKMEDQNKLVSHEWIKYVENVLREYKLFKDQLIVYFKSVCGLMSSQLRRIIIKSLKCYYEFMIHYKHDKYFSAQEVFEQQFNPKFPFQQSFIVIDIVVSPDSNCFCFSDDVDDIHAKLTSIMEDIIKCSNEVERPDNMFIKKINKRNNLWKVTEDKEVTFMKKVVNEIIIENNKVIELVLKLYDQFVFILNEQSNIDKVKASHPKRDDIRRLIKQYEEKLKILRVDIPDSIYLNMVRIDCKDINKLLRDKLYEFILDLLKYISVKNINGKAKELYDRMEKLRGDLNNHAQDEETLALLENNYDFYKNEQLPHIESDYNDFLEWVFFYLEYDTYPIMTDAGKDSLGNFDSNLKMTHSSLISLEPALEAMNASLKEKKAHFDVNLQKTRVFVTSLVTKLKADVDEVKDSALSYFIRDDSGITLLHTLKDLEKRAHDADLSLKSLIRKEELLSSLLTDDDRVDQCIKDIEVLINYVSFYCDFRTIQSDLDHLEIKYMEFSQFFSFIERSADIFDISLQKIPSLKGRINKFRTDFENFKSTVELAKLIYGLVELLKYDLLAEENPQLFDDNNFFCKKFCSNVFPELKDINKAQEYLKNLKFKEILINKPNFLTKNNSKSELEKVIQDWETVKQIYDVIATISGELDVDIKTENFKDKKYIIISHSSFEKSKQVLTKAVKLTDENIFLVESSLEKINILKKAIDYKNKLLELHKTVDNLENTQLNLENLMNKSIILQKGDNDSFIKLKQAEQNYTKLIIHYFQHSPKLFDLLTYMDVLQDHINTVNIYLSEISLNLIE